MNNDGIKIEYTLTRDDVYSVLKKTKTFKTAEHKWIYTVVFAVCIVVNLIGFFKDSNPLSGFVALLCVAMIVAVWFLPEFEMKKQAKKSGSDHILTACFLKNEVLMGDSEENSWTIDLEKSHYLIDNDYIIIFAQNGKIAAFPKKDISDSNYSAIKELVTASATLKSK